MKQYKITVEELTEQLEKTYPRSEKIYEQVVDTLSIEKIVAVVNQIEKKD